MHLKTKRRYPQTLFNRAPQANPNGKDEDDVTALHWAANNNRHTVVPHLLPAKADIKAVTCNGWTALHSAAYRGSSAVVEQLLQAKADPTAVDKSGDTPAQWAEFGHHAELAQRLHAAEGGQ